MLPSATCCSGECGRAAGLSVRGAGRPRRRRRRDRRQAAAEPRATRRTAPPAKARWSPARPGSPARVCWATIADPTSRARPSPPPRRRSARPRGPQRDRARGDPAAAGDDAGARRPAAHRRARPATSSTRCARWACSRASWPRRCPTDPTDQPSYLGTVIHDLPGAGSRSDPDLDGDQGRRTRPDPGLGGADARGLSRSCRRSRRRCSAGAPGAAWKDNLRTVGAATGRLEAANAVIDDFDRAADKTGADNDATHFQASVVQFTDTTMRVFGVDNFPGSVLADVGRGSPCGTTVHRQALRRDRHLRRRSRRLARLLHRRRRHRLRLVRLGRGQGTRPAGDGQRRVAAAVGQPRQPGLRRQQRGVADRRRASSPRAASSPTCAGSTPRSTERRPGMRSIVTDSRSGLTARTPAVDHRLSRTVAACSRSPARRSAAGAHSIRATTKDVMSTVIRVCSHLGDRAADQDHHHPPRRRARTTWPSTSTSPASVTPTSTPCAAEWGEVDVPDGARATRSRASSPRSAPT